MRQEGYRFAFDPTACNSCSGRCCTGESGNIFVSAAEIGAIAELLGLDETEFRRDYLRKHGYKFSLKELKTAESYDCVFFDRERNGCSIYEARPLQCRTFPFWDYYKNRVDALKMECPGIVDD